MSYTLKQVDAAEARIRAECPTAHVARGNYGLSLSVAMPDKSAAYFVFDAGRNRPTVIGDIDKIIAKLKAL